MTQISSSETHQSFSYRDTDDRLSKGVIVSLIIHLSFFSFILLKSLIFPGKPIRLVPTLRVDIVGLPDILKKDIPVTAPPPAASEPHANDFKPKVDSKPVPEEVAKPDEMVLKPKKKKEEVKEVFKKDPRDKKLKSAIDRIKSLNKIQSSLDKVKASNTPAVVIKGNKVSPGTSLSGDAKEAAEANYFDGVRDQLQAHWALPVWLSRQTLAAQVRIFIDSHGLVRRTQWIQASGNAQFDQAIKQTIAESQPFPIPSASVADAVLNDGIVVGFPL